MLLLGGVWSVANRRLSEGCSARRVVRHVQNGRMETGDLDDRQHRSALQWSWSHWSCCLWISYLLVL